MKKQINEANRNQLIRKSKAAKKYSGKPGNRFDARVKCHVANTVKDYNKIDMDSFWKNDFLSFDVKVEGETNNYLVTFQFNNILKKIADEVKSHKNLFDRDIVTKALIAAVNSSDIKINCTCPDFKFRQAYQASKNGYKAGQQETRASNVTNPDDNLGAGCKHVLCAINNSSWIRNVASVIVNYANYIKDNSENLYAKYIFPKIYGMSYKQAIQMTLDDVDSEGNEVSTLKSDEATINLSNMIGKSRGKYKKK